VNLSFDIKNKANQIREYADKASIMRRQQTYFL